MAALLNPKRAIRISECISVPARQVHSLANGAPCCWTAQTHYPDRSQAGGHEAHDYAVYQSPHGGCCDCGNESAWKLHGCCPRHRSGLHGQGLAVMHGLSAAAGNLDLGMHRMPCKSR